MANREEGVAAPNWRQGQEQPQHQDAVGQQHLNINWSNFQPEFSGKPEEDAEAHLLHSNDWMNAHHFDEDTKVQRFQINDFSLEANISKILSYTARRSKIVVSF